MLQSPDKTGDRAKALPIIVEYLPAEMLGRGQQMTRTAKTSYDAAVF
jgi:hypothetical protein